MYYYIITIFFIAIRTLKSVDKGISVHSCITLYFEAINFFERIDKTAKIILVI